MEIKRVCVLGAGLMGHGIAQVCAQAGCQVSMRARRETSLTSGMEKIQKFLKGSVERKRMSQEEADATLSRIKTTTDLKEAAKDADLVIECVTEDLEAKKNLFQELDDICPQHAIFATNTSYQPTTEMASVTKRPDKFLGTHWFNPPQIMRGVEVVRGEKTSQETLDAVVNLLKKLGKEPVLCKDSPGFIVNRLLQPWRNEGLKIFDEAVALLEDIDTAYKTGCGFRMGPFEFLDLVGIETAAVGNETLYRELKSDMYTLPQCHKMKVRAGDFGRKTGRGFYEYGKK